LLANSQHNLCDIPIAVCTVLDSWWCAEKVPETRRVLFQKYIWEISASRWFYYKNISRCTASECQMDTCICKSEWKKYYSEHF